MQAGAVAKVSANIVANFLAATKVGGAVGVDDGVSQSDLFFFFFFFLVADVLARGRWAPGDRTERRPAPLRRLFIGTSRRWLHFVGRRLAGHFSGWTDSPPPTAPDDRPHPRRGIAPTDDKLRHLGLKRSRRASPARCGAKVIADSCAIWSMLLSHEAMLVSGTDS